MRYLLYVCFLSLLIAESCNEIEDCQLDPYGDYAIASFNLLDPQDRIIAFDSITLNGIRVEGDTITVMALPLDAEDNNALYSYYTDSTVYELSIDYETEGAIYELHCEASIRYFNLDTAYQTFDSVAIISDQIFLNQSTFNFEVYF